MRLPVWVGRSAVRLQPWVFWPIVVAIRAADQRRLAKPPSPYSLESLSNEVRPPIIWMGDARSRPSRVPAPDVPLVLNFVLTARARQAGLASAKAAQSEGLQPWRGSHWGIGEEADFNATLT